MRKSLIVLVTLVLGLTTLSFANVTAVSSQVFLQTSSSADFISCSIVVDSHGQSQGATLNPLSASVSALSQCNGASVISFADVAAAFASANAGSIGFGNIGWSTTNVSQNGLAQPNQGLDYNYSFFANANESLNLSYATAGGPPLEGFDYLDGFFVNLVGPNGNYNYTGLNTSGILSWNLVAGNSYSLTITNLANIGGVIGTYNASMSGQFGFSTAATTPEPSSLLLLGTGLVGAVGVVRRKIKL